MGKKVYSKEEFNQLLFHKISEVRNVYIYNRDILSIEEIENDFNKFKDILYDESFEPAPLGEIKADRNEFEEKFKESILDIKIIFDVLNFSKIFKENADKNFVYTYFTSKINGEISLGFRFSNNASLKEDLDTNYNDNFYVLENRILNFCSQNEFKIFVTKFKDDYEEFIKSRGIMCATMYVKDLTSDAINIINKNPTDIEIFLIISDGKLKTATYATIDGAIQSFNRGQQWP